MPNLITTEEIAALLGGDVSRQRVSTICKEYDIPHYSGYDRDAFLDGYFYPRKRFELARSMGATVNGLVSHDEWDKPDNCPECEAFAVYAPPTQEEFYKGYAHGARWMCINGHSGIDPSE